MEVIIPINKMIFNLSWHLTSFSLDNQDNVSSTKIVKSTNVPNEGDAYFLTE